MGPQADILLLGSGAFAARIAFDLAAAARQPTRVVVAGRNAARLAWVRTAANARSVIFGGTARFETETLDLMQPDVAEALLRLVRPAVVVQAASAQTGNVIADAGDAWGSLVAEGGLSATTVFQAMLSVRVARAVRQAHPGAHLVNCCFPDVVNPMLAALGLAVTCGTGNVSILATAFAGSAGCGCWRTTRRLRPGGSRPTRGTVRRLACGWAARRSRTCSRGSGTCG